MIIWFSLIWTLSLVHLMEGIIGIGFLTLISYILQYVNAWIPYSLASLGALGLAPYIQLRMMKKKKRIVENGDESKEYFHANPRKISEYFLQLLLRFVLHCYS